MTIDKEAVLKEVLASNLSEDSKIYIIQNLGKTTTDKFQISDNQISDDSILDIKMGVSAKIGEEETLALKPFYDALHPELFKTVQEDKK